MSTPIIIGGDRARAAITNLENASLLMDCTQRAAAEALCKTLEENVQAMCDEVDYTCVWPE